MEHILNIAQKLILVKDMSNDIDFSVIQKEFANLEFRTNALNAMSVETNFFDRKVFKSIKVILENECKNYLNFTTGIGGTYDDLKITKSWGNVTHGGQAHHEHTHPFSVVSGVIFLDNHPSNALLTIKGYVPEIPYFVPNAGGYFKLEDTIKQTNVDPKEHKNLQNHLVLFLSNSSHYVQQIPENSSPRRTLSFNTFWKGEVGKGFAELSSIKF